MEKQAVKKRDSWTAGGGLNSLHRPQRRRDRCFPIDKEAGHTPHNLPASAWRTGAGAPHKQSDTTDERNLTVQRRTKLSMSSKLRASGRRRMRHNGRRVTPRFADFRSKNRGPRRLPLKPPFSEGDEKLWTNRKVNKRQRRRAGRAGTRRRQRRSQTVSVGSENQIYTDLSSPAVERTLSGTLHLRPKKIPRFCSRGNTDTRVFNFRSARGQHRWRYRAKRISDLLGEESGACEAGTCARRNKGVTGGERATGHRTKNEIWFSCGKSFRERKVPVLYLNSRY